MNDGSSDSGEWLGRYELVKQLGTGGMAEVWLAIEHGPEGSQKQVALKRLLPEVQHDQQFVAGLMDEANIAARITHPNVVQIYELGQEGETFFLAMEYLPGVSLSDIQRRARWTGKRLSVELASLIVSQLCRGLDHAHRLVDGDGVPLQIVHRDVSPQNVMVLFDGGVKLLDFGIAKARERMTPMTAAHVIKGKLAYMSPEQIGAKPVDARTDLFACGVVYWELVTGQLVSPEAPPQFKPLASLRELCPTVPPAVEGVVVRALAVDPEDRFQSAGEMSEALEAVLGRMDPVTDSDLAEYVADLFEVDKQRGSDDMAWRLSHDPTVARSSPEHELSQEHTTVQPRAVRCFADAEDAGEIADTQQHQQPPEDPDTREHQRVLREVDDDHHQSQLASRLKQSGAPNADGIALEIEFAVAGVSNGLERGNRQRRSRGKIALWAALPAMLVVCLVALWPSGSEKKTIVEIHSSPPGAAVYIDGQKPARGVTPLLLRGLKPGVHRCELVLPEHQQWRDEVLVLEGERTKVDAQLVRREQPRSP